MVKVSIKTVNRNNLEPISEMGSDTLPIRPPPHPLIHTDEI